MEGEGVTDTNHLQAHIEQARQRQDVHERRLDSHEIRLTKLEIHTAGETVRSQNIETSLAKIEGGVTWITRLVIGGILAGFLAFIISGGLNVGS